MPEITFTKEQQVSFMRLAMAQVEESIKELKPPFGAVLVNEHGEVLAAAHNIVTPETSVLNHAELQLLALGAEKYKRQKFADCAVFVNAASCSMCASALVQSDIRNFYYGSPFEPHTNPSISYEILAKYCNEPLTIHGGVLKEECIAQIERGRQAQLSSK